MFYWLRFKIVKEKVAFNVVYFTLLVVYNIHEALTMILIYSGSKKATTCLKKPHRQDREQDERRLGGGGAGRSLGSECSIERDSMLGMGRCLGPTFLENIKRRNCNDRNRKLIPILNDPH